MKTSKSGLNAKINYHRYVGGNSMIKDFLFGMGIGSSVWVLYYLILVLGQYIRSYVDRDKNTLKETLHDAYQETNL